jgi:small subunit ribosomal protein S4
MAVYHGPQCKLCRREGVKLMLRGERCVSEKCAMERRPFPPGIRTTKRRRTSTEYNTQLREKQKIRRMYGVLERQFERYFASASRAEGVTGERLLQILELRLDNIVYRLGFAPSRNCARQLVTHGHFTVNGKKVTLPAYQVKAGDVVAVREGSTTIQAIHSALKNARDIPDWLSVDKVKLEGTVMRVPDRASMPVNVQERLVVEHYSR